MLQKRIYSSQTIWIFSKILWRACSS